MNIIALPFYKNYVKKLVSVIALSGIFAAIVSWNMPFAWATPGKKNDHYNDLTAIRIMFGRRLYGTSASHTVTYFDVTGKKDIAVWAGQTIWLQSILGSGIDAARKSDLRDQAVNGVIPPPPPQWYADGGGEPVADRIVASDKSYAKLVYLTDASATYSDGTPINLSGGTTNNDIHWYWLKTGTNLEAKYTVFTVKYGQKIGWAKFDVTKPTSAFTAQMVQTEAWLDGIFPQTYAVGLGRSSGEPGDTWGITFTYHVIKGPTVADHGKTDALGSSQLLQTLKTWKSTNYQTQGDKLAGLQTPILDHSDWPADFTDAPGDSGMVWSSGDELSFAATTYLTWKYPDGIDVTLQKIPWNFDIDVEPSDIPDHSENRPVGYFFKPRSATYPTGTTTLTGMSDDTDIVWNSNCTK